jgi:CelD/BcsL family acetyltransferase involved in cellulose biosynthesis
MFLPRDGGTLAALQMAASAAHRPQLSRVLEHCPIVPITGTFPDYLAQRRGHMAREIRRRRRKLAERGQFEFAVVENGANLPELLDEGLAVEASGWKGERGTAVGSSDRTRAFYLELARWLADRGELRLAFLRLDGKAFAFDFGIESLGRHSLLKTGYDPAFRADAPGVLLRASMIERAFDRGLERYDFLGKDDPWKREWTELTKISSSSKRSRCDPMGSRIGWLSAT